MRLSQGCSTLLSFLAQHPGTLSLELFGNRIGVWFALLSARFRAPASAAGRGCNHPEVAQNCSKRRLTIIRFRTVDAIVEPRIKQVPPPYPGATFRLPWALK